LASSVIRDWHSLGYSASSISTSRLRPMRPDRLRYEAIQGERIMPVKLKAAKARNFSITDEMVRLYQRGKELQTEIDNLQAERNAVSCELDRLLCLKPWEMSPLDARDVMPVPRLNDRYEQSGKTAQEIRRALEEAARQKRKGSPSRRSATDPLSDSLPSTKRIIDSLLRPDEPFEE
jgi:hypothetical protein